jgi:hypothetical protein
MKPIRANILPPLSSTRGNDLKSTPVDELWKLHEEVTVERAQKLELEKTGLQQRLRQFYVADNESPLSATPPFAPMRSPKVGNRKAKTPPGEAGAFKMGWGEVWGNLMRLRRP